MNYKLRPEQEERFEKCYINYQDKIRLAVFKCNISTSNFEHFYSHALEGFLQSFLMLEAGQVSEEDFPALAFTNMKRKVIDEIRRISRNKDIAINIEENYSNLAFEDNRFDEYVVKSSIIRKLNKRERKVFEYLEKGYSYKEISQLEKVSKSSYYNIVAAIRNKTTDLLYK